MNVMNLALFDLDNTLLDGDAETLWFEYLHQAGHLDGDFFGKLEEFTNDYDPVSYTHLTLPTSDLV